MCDGGGIFSDHQRSQSPPPYNDTMDYLGIQDLVPLRCQIIHDPGDGSLQGNATNKEDGEDHIGEGGCEIDHLGGQRDQRGRVRRTGIKNQFINNSIKYKVSSNVIRKNVQNSLSCVKWDKEATNRSGPAQPGLDLCITYY